MSIDHQPLPVGGGIGRVRDPDLAHAVGGQPLDEQPVNFRRRVFERQVPGRDDTQGRGRRRLDQPPHAVPGIVFEIAHHLFEKGNVQYFHCLVAGAIQLVRDRYDHVGGQRTRPQAGIAISQGRVHKMQGLHRFSLSGGWLGIRRHKEPSLALSCQLHTPQDVSVPRTGGPRFPASGRSRQNHA